MPRDVSLLRPPDTGAPWLDLLATVGSAYGPAPIERLTGPARLAEWLELAELAPTQPLTAADVEAAKLLRETLRPIGLAVATGRAPDPDGVTALNEIVATERSPRLDIREGHLVARPPVTASDALARVARQAVDHLAGPEAAHLGTCADHDCSMLFLDPGGRRRWCSAAVCGVRHRVRAHRARAGTTGAEV